MKRYAVFAMQGYYPSGGWSDLHDLFDTKKDVLEAVSRLRCDWYEVVDLKEGKIIDERAIEE